MIRRMRLGDLDKVARIESSVFKDPWPIKYFKEEIENNQFACLLVIEENDEIMAYGDIWFMFENADICNIAVASDYQHRGYGQRMLNALFREAIKNEVEFVHLEVRPSNEYALKLYQKNEFIQTRIRKSYYEDGEDAIEMVKAIGGLNEEDFGY